MERIRHQEVRRTAVEEPEPQSVSVLEPPDAHEQDIEVIYGVGIQRLPLAGMQVAEARELLQSILQVDPQAHALINGRPARGSQRIVQGDVLEFAHHAGEKGARYGPSHRNRR